MDNSWEHAQHGKMIKGISGRTCYECWKEYQAIISKNKVTETVEPYRGYSQEADFMVLNSINGKLC